MRRKRDAKHATASHRKAYRARAEPAVNTESVVRRDHPKRPRQPDGFALQHVRRGIFAESDMFAGLADAAGAETGRIERLRMARLGAFP